MDFNRIYPPNGNFSIGDVSDNLSCKGSIGKIFTAGAGMENDCNFKCKPGFVGGANTAPNMCCKPCRPQQNFTAGANTCRPGCHNRPEVEAETTQLCRNTLGFVPDLSLAMAYVPDQRWECICDCETGFHLGTIFKQLDKPLRSNWRCQR